MEHQPINSTRYASPSFTSFGLPLLKIFLSFFLGGVLLSYAADSLLIGFAVLMDSVEQTNRVALEMKSTVSMYPLLALVAPIVYLKSQFTTATLASLCFLVFRHVPFWCVVAVAPVAVVGAGFSLFVDLGLYAGKPPRPQFASTRFAMLLVFQLSVSLTCWWVVRFVRLGSVGSARSPTADSP